MDKNGNSVKKILIILAALILIGGVYSWFAHNGAFADTFYCDPVAGNTSTGDGSVGSPWGTLQSVVEANLIISRSPATNPYDGTVQAKNAGGTVAAGDTIVLKEGASHGILTLNAYLNSDWIVIKAASGENPVIQQMAISGAWKWRFEGIEVREDITGIVGDANSGVVYISSSNTYGTTKWIVFDNCTIRTTLSNANWGDGYETSIDDSTRHGVRISPTGAHVDTAMGLTWNSCTIQQVRRAFWIAGGDSITITNNTISNMMADGIQLYYSDEVYIADNTMVDWWRVNTDHLDGMQLLAADDDSVCNLTLERNLIQHYTSTRTDTLKDSQLAGIGGHRPPYYNIQIINNKILCATSSGITLGDAHQCKIINNTIVDDGSVAGQTVSILVGNDTDWSGQPEQTIIQNNIVEAITYSGDDMTVSNNHLYTNTDIFVDYSTFDVDIVAGASACRDQGDATNAPADDYNGDTRDANPDIGADEYLGGGSERTWYWHPELGDDSGNYSISPGAKTLTALVDSLTANDHIILLGGTSEGDSLVIDYDGVVVSVQADSTVRLSGMDELNGWITSGSGALLTETFDTTPGYDNTWSETVGTGTTVDEDGDPADISTPTGFSGEALHTERDGDDTDNAYTRTDLGEDKTDTSTEFYIYIESAAFLANGESVLLGYAEDSSNADSWQIRLGNSSGQYRINWYANLNGGAPDAIGYTNIDTLTSYKLTLNYDTDAADSSFSFSVNDGEVFNGTLSAGCPAGVQYLTLGIRNIAGGGEYMSVWYDGVTITAPVTLSANNLALPLTGDAVNISHVTINDTTATSVTMPNLDAWGEYHINAAHDTLYWWVNDQDADLINSTVKANTISRQIIVNGNNFTVSGLEMGYANEAAIYMNADTLSAQWLTIFGATRGLDVGDANDLTVQNNIIYDNGTGVYGADGDRRTMGYNNVNGNTLDWDTDIGDSTDTGNIDSDPLFTSYPSVLTLGAGSPSRYAASDGTDQGAHQVTRSLSITAPSAGDTLQVGTAETISWTPVGIDTVIVSYSNDDGYSYTVIDTVEASDGTKSWTVAELGGASDSLWVRVADINGLASDAVALYAEDDPVVTAPNGGETLVAGNAYNITWTNNGSALVKIEYSTDNGSNWTTIVASTAASAGTYPWTVPSVATSQGLIRITSTANASLTDQSDGVFTIEATETETVLTTFGKSWGVGKGAWGMDGKE